MARRQENRNDLRRCVSFTAVFCSVVNSSQHIFADTHLSVNIIRCPHAWGVQSLLVRLKLTKIDCSPHFFLFNLTCRSYPGIPFPSVRQIQLHFFVGIWDVSRSICHVILEHCRWHGEEAPASSSSCSD